jgi:hypothetical protein
VLEAQELGAYINGSHRIIGGSPERLLNLVQGTLYLLSKVHLSKKLAQVIAGRWIMMDTCFSVSATGNVSPQFAWKFTSDKGINSRLVWQVRREFPRAFERRVLPIVGVCISSSHLHIFSSSHLLLLPSCPLALSFFSISLLKAGAGAVPTRRHETQPFRTKRGSIAQN